MKYDLPDYIPDNIKKYILEQEKAETFSCDVFRVDKKGTGKVSFLDCTFIEFKNTPFLKKIDLKSPSTYSTSVYDNLEYCIQYIKSLKGRLRRVYPSPQIMKGKITNGYATYTGKIENSHHIDWWIYKGMQDKAFEEFKIYDQE